MSGIIHLAREGVRELENCKAFQVIKYFFFVRNRCSNLIWEKILMKVQRTTCRIRVFLELCDLGHMIVEKVRNFVEHFDLIIWSSLGV